MSIDEQIGRAKELIARREEIDKQLAELFAGSAPERKAIRCKTCGELGHRAKTCTAKLPAEQSSVVSTL